MYEIFRSFAVSELGCRCCRNRDSFNSSTNQWRQRLRWVWLGKVVDVEKDKRCLLKWEGGSRRDLQERDSVITMPEERQGVRLFRTRWNGGCPLTPEEGSASFYNFPWIFRVSFSFNEVALEAGIFSFKYVELDTTTVVLIFEDVVMRTMPSVPGTVFSFIFLMILSGMGYIYLYHIRILTSKLLFLCHQNVFAQVWVSNLCSANQSHPLLRLAEWLIGQFHILIIKFCVTKCWVKTEFSAQHYHLLYIEFLYTNKLQYTYKWQTCTLINCPLMLNLC